MGAEFSIYAARSFSLKKDASRPPQRVAHAFLVLMEKPEEASPRNDYIIEELHSFYVECQTSTFLKARLKGKGGNRLTEFNKVSSGSEEEILMQWEVAKEAAWLLNQINVEYGWGSDCRDGVGAILKYVSKGLERKSLPHLEMPSADEICESMEACRNSGLLKDCDEKSLIWKKDEYNGQEVLGL